MRIIDADELLERIWRSDVSSREKIADIINSTPTLIHAATREELFSAMLRGCYIEK